MLPVDCSIARCFKNLLRQLPIAVSVDSRFYDRPRAGCRRRLEIICSNVALFFVFLSVLPSTPGQAAEAPRAPIEHPASNLKKPRVRFKQPTDGQTVGGLFQIAVEVDHDQPITQVIFSKDGAVMTIDFEPPFEVAWETTREADGPHTLSAKALDVDFREGMSDRISVVIDNVVPTVMLVAPAEGAVVSNEVQLEATAGDVVGIKAVRFLVNGDAAGDVESPPYIFHWNTEVIPNGRYSVKARAIDRAGNTTVSNGVTVRVANFNRNPILDPISSKTVPEGEPLVFQVKAHDPDGARDPLAYTVTNLPPWAELDPKSAEVRGTPGFAVASTDEPKKEYAGIRFEVCDPEPLCDSKQMSITVVNRNYPPVMQPIGNQVLDEKQLLNIPLQVSDPNGDPLMCKARGLPKWASLSPKTCVLKGTPGPETATLMNPVTVYEGIRLEVCDPDEECARQTIKISVNDTENRPPVFQPPQQDTVDEGKTLSVVISAPDPDRDPVTLTASNLPNGAVFEDQINGTATFNWTPRFDQAGAYEIQLKATDEILTSTAVFKIIVRQQGLVISGRIIENATDSPLAGATVKVSAHKEVAQEVLTDAQGYYVAKNLSAGTYEVKPIYLPKSEFSSQARKLVPAKFTPSRRRVTITNKDEPNIDFTASFP